MDPHWIRAHHHTFDLMHIHFGFDALSPATLHEIVEGLHAAGKPLVLTVHDLRNPHHDSRELHDRHLDVLVPAADAVVTLTSGAAREIASRWARDAHVLPHPHVVDLPRLTRRPAHNRQRTVASGFRVGLHLKSLRPCMSGAPMVDALTMIARDRPQLSVVVDAHSDVARPDGARADESLIAALHRASAAGVDVRVHDFYTDDELWDYLEGLDLAVLPYRYGTHSGWLEACRDLGTAVAAPRCGYYAEQGARYSFHLDETSLDVGSLAAAIDSAMADPPAPPISVSTRVEQRELIARAHAQIYRTLLR